ncbi:MAG: GNAT family N-acetyltransferase [Streptococcaceae bacterium]|nr:GNAT family N-acetyltransferase [Streptococcaceae bacterium]
MPLLLLADDARFIPDYLETGAMWVFENQAVAIVADNELLNFAVAEAQQGLGLGREFLSALTKIYPSLSVRTDAFTAHFYEKCGFVSYKVVKNYFPEKYGHPVFDKGREIRDNIYLRKVENEN